MRLTVAVMSLLLVLGISSAVSAFSPQDTSSLHNEAPLDKRIPHFELSDATLIDGISKLASQPIEGLHLGIEDILREKFSDISAPSIRFSLSLENGTVREILDALCNSDSRYVWSTDETTINIYPSQTIGDLSYLPKHTVERITLRSISGPVEALEALARALPDQIGVAQVGVYRGYRQSWTVTFDHLTIRQFMNRISEHTGSQSCWVLHGATDQRFFAFTNGSFHY